MSSYIFEFLEEEMKEQPIAHVAEDGRIHGLEEHLRETAEMAAEFAAAFGCQEWGRLAGLWHDLSYNFV